MPEIHCGKCGTIVRPTDLFCRICGSPLDSTTLVEERTQNARLGQSGKKLEENDVISLKLPMSNRTACLITAVLLFSTLVLVMILFIFLANRSDGRPAIAIEFIGTSTPYSTRRPYATAVPFKTATPYPTAVPYPTTGPLATVAPATGASEPPFVYIVPSFNFGGCRLSVKNQNIYLDSVIILSNIDTNDIAAAVYVRASDSFSKSGISTGTYHTYIATGQDWDAITGRFINNADYFRFKDAVVFDTCSSFGYGSYQYFEVTLNVTEGSGSDTISVPLESFPSFSP